MAIIDKITGYYGFTIDIDPENPAINNNGEVKTCLIAFTFNQQTSDVDVTVSQGEDDFAVKTGDGQIIPCRNPKVIYTNRDNAIVQFDMEREYPANSPLSLVYHSNTAKFTINQRADGRPFEVNSVSGHFAYTVEGYKGSNITDTGFDGSDKYTGLVNKVMATIPFKYSPTAVRAELSQGENDWGIRMGNGQIIPLKDPEVVTVNQNNFIALFTMHDGYSYPSNSPGILVYRSASAKIEVIPQDDDHNFYPVRNIYDVPASMISGQTIDLNCAKVEPFNASVQYINWSVVSGPGEIIDSHYLHATKGGSIIINGTIENGLEGDDLSNDYFQRFTIETVQNVITKFTDPIPEIKTYVGEINHTIAVVAESSTDRISYQWYHNTADSYTDATPITKDGNNASYVIPETLTKGDHYYFCKIMSDGAVDVLSAKCHIYASIRCTSITIYPLDNTMGWESSRQMYIVQYPSDADLPAVKWFSSNDNIAKFDEVADPKTGLLVKPGLLHSKFPEIRKDGSQLTAHDTVTITAMTTDVIGEQLSASIDIIIDTFVPVEDITGLTLNVNPDNTYTLTATVVPYNATNQNIVWNVADSNNSDVYITDGVLHVPNSVIPKDHQLGCTIMATIENGSSTHNKYQKEFEVYITHGFVPVTDIIINNDTDRLYDIGNSIDLIAAPLPTGSSIKDISWSLISGSAELHGNSLTFTTAGNVTLRATIKKGAGTIINMVDFSKDFVFKCSNLSITPVENIDLTFHHSKIVKTPEMDATGKPTGNYITETFDMADNNLNPYEKIISGGTETEAVVSGVFKLPLTIIPNDATNKTMIIELQKVSYREKPSGYDDPGYEIPDGFYDQGWQIMNNGAFRLENDVVFIDKTAFEAGNLYRATIKITIRKGLSSNADYVQTINFNILAPDIEPFIPIRDMTFEFLPAKLRALSPVLLSIYEIDPINASVKDNRTNHVNLDKGNGGVDFKYSMEMVTDPDKGDSGPQPILFFGSVGEVGFAVDPLPIFEWDWNEFYLYPWNPGKCKVKLSFSDSTVPNINSYNKYYPEKVPFEKEFEFDFLPPFIPVGLIKGVATTIYANQPYIIQGDATNIEGTKNYNPAWDDEDVTDKNITYSIISNTANASLSGKTLLATRAGSVTIRATVAEGLAEQVVWYKGKKQDAVSYTQDFVITVVGEEAAFSRNIVTLTLQDNSKVGIDKFGELLLLSTPEESNTNITIKGKTFRKDQVIRADFYEDIHNDLQVSYVSTPVSTVEFDDSDVKIKLLNGINTDPYSVNWEIVSGTGGELTSDNQKEYANLNINQSQIAVGGSIKVKCTVIGKKADDTADNEGKVEREVEFKKVASRTGAWAPNPNLTSLENFGRNFVNLTTINRIPNEVTGAGCLRNFLRGCTHLNCNITIPENVTGEYCLEFFLRDCTNFNSNLVVPNRVTGAGAMHGFLMNCTHFNRVINIPDSIAGEFCLKKFMYNCSSFNQALIIPRGVSGKACMFEFMAFCSSFNQPITLPDDVGLITMHNDFTNQDYIGGYHLDLMLFNASNYHSTITVPVETGNHAMFSEKSFATAKYNSPMITYGITFDGPGAALFWTRNDPNKLANHYQLEDGELPWGPYRHFTNLD